MDPFTSFETFKLSKGADSLDQKVSRVCQPSSWLILTVLLMMVVGAPGGIFSEFSHLNPRR